MKMEVTGRRAVGGRGRRVGERESGFSLDIFLRYLSNSHMEPSRTHLKMAGLEGE